MTPACLMHGFTCLRTFVAKQDGVQQLWPLRLNLTRPYDDFNFEELLSGLLITIAWMITTVPCLVRSDAGVELTL